MSPSHTVAISSLGLTLILGSLTAFAPLSTDMYLASFSSVAETFAADEGRVQLSLSIFFFGLSVGQLIYGPLVDRFGRKPPLMVGLVIFTLASAAIVVVPTVEGFIALRLCQALGGCAGMVVSRGNRRRSVRRARQRPLSVADDVGAGFGADRGASSGRLYSGGGPLGGDLRRSRPVWARLPVGHVICTSGNATARAASRGWRRWRCPRLW